MKRLSLFAGSLLCIITCANSHVHYIASDINTVGVQGSVIESASASPFNGPEAYQWFTGINLLANSNPDFVTQLGAGFNGRLWTRRSFGGSWGNWSELLTTGNFNTGTKADRGFEQNKDFNVYTAPGLYEFDGVMPNAPNGSPNFRVVSMGNDGRWSQMAFQWDSDRAFFRRKTDTYFSTWMEFWHSGNFNPANYFMSNGGSITGDVIIGTTAAQKELAVNGNIKTRKVKVTSTEWADYVFDSSYRLAPLTQVEKFIQANKHLPEVPSEAEVKKEGLDIGDNQAVLLRKIEELTLYIINQEKRIKELERKIN